MATAHLADHPSGLMRWLTSTNHKDIGTLYLFFALAMFFVGAGLSADEYKARVQQALTDNLQSSNGKNVEIENYLTRVPEYVRNLAREFCYAFGTQPTKTEDKFWRKSWEDQYEIGLKSEFISKAIEKMKEDGLTYKSPASVTAIAEWLMREGLTVVDPYKRYNAVYDSAGERIK